GRQHHHPRLVGAGARRGQALRRRGDGDRSARLVVAGARGARRRGRDDDQPRLSSRSRLRESGEEARGLRRRDRAPGRRKMSEKLKLRCEDADDLVVLSSVLQDAAMPLAEIAWLPQERRFVMVASRFAWDKCIDVTLPPEQANIECYWRSNFG